MRRAFRIVGGLDIERDGDGVTRAEARRRARPILRHWLRLVGQGVADGALSPTDYLLAQALTHYPSANYGRCWAGQQRLADTLGRTTRTIRTSLTRLCRAGLLAGKRGAPGRTAVWTFCDGGAPLFGGNVVTQKTTLKQRNNSAQDRKFSSGLERKKTSAKPLEQYPLEQEPPPYPPAQAQADPPQGNRDVETLAGSAPLEGEVLGPETLLTFDEFWRSILGGKGKLGPAIAAWRGLSDDDRRAIRARIGPLGLNTEGMWACMWLSERRWERDPLNTSDLDSFTIPPPVRHVELAPYSAGWIAERDRKRAAGEPLALMEDWAREGKGWMVRCP